MGRAACAPRTAENSAWPLGLTRKTAFGEAQNEANENENAATKNPICQRYVSLSFLFFKQQSLFKVCV